MKRTPTYINRGLSTKEYQRQYRQLERLKKRRKIYGKRFYLRHKEELQKRHKKHFEENKEKYSIRNKKNHIAREYNITLEVFNELLDKQNNKCAICQKDFIGISPCVDHNHETKGVRGLLCRKCNLNLHAIENKEYMAKAIRYLKINEVIDKELLR